MSEAGEAVPGLTRFTVFVRGDVQGVGFRWWVTAQARELGVVGYAKNLPDGRVELLAQGGPGALQELFRRVGEDPSSRDRPGRVTGLTAHEARPVSGHSRFEER